MDGSRYFVRGRTFDGADAALQDALAQVYESSEQSRCMCVPGGIEMYVAKHAESSSECWARDTDTSQFATLSSLMRRSPASVS